MKTEPPIIPPLICKIVPHREYRVLCDVPTMDVEKPEPDPSATAVPGKYLPREKEVYASSSTVLILGNSRKDLEDDTQFYFGLDNDYLEDIFKFKGDNAIVTVGRDGDLKFQNDWVSDGAGVLVEIRKAPDKNGYLVKDTSLYGTKVSTYYDFSNRPDGAPIPSSLEVLVNKDSKLKLGREFILDFKSPEIQKQLEKLHKGQAYILGRFADIKLENCPESVSNRHIQIRDIGNYYAVKNVSLNGTTIVNPKYRDKWTHRVNKQQPMAEWQRKLMYDPYHPVQMDDKEWYLQKPPFSD